MKLKSGMIVLDDVDGKAIRRLIEKKFNSLSGFCQQWKLDRTNLTKALYGQIPLSVSRLDSILQAFGLTVRLDVRIERIESRGNEHHVP